MDNLEYYITNKYVVLDGLFPNRNSPKKVNVYKESVPSCTIIKEWTVEIKRDRTSFENVPVEGRLKAVHHMIQAN